jgi:DNA-binding response OmpR family regulator
VPRRALRPEGTHQRSNTIDCSNTKKQEPTAFATLRPNTSLTVRGLSPTHATSDEAAADLFQASSVDLIILDVGPPGISDFDGLEALRGQEAQTPVIFLTAKDSVDTTLASFDGGADAFLPRPFSF